MTAVPVATAWVAAALLVVLAWHARDEAFTSHLLAPAVFLAAGVVAVVSAFARGVRRGSGDAWFALMFIFTLAALGSFPFVVIGAPRLAGGALEAPIGAAVLAVAVVNLVVLVRVKRSTGLRVLPPASPPR